MNEPENPEPAVAVQPFVRRPKSLEELTALELIDAIQKYRWRVSPGGHWCSWKITHPAPMGHYREDAEGLSGSGGSALEAFTEALQHRGVISLETNVSGQQRLTETEQTERSPENE